MAPIRLALFGAGIFAREAHQPALLPHLASGGASVTAVWSRTSASSTALAASYAASEPSAPAPDALHGESAIAPLLARDDIDAVILAVPIPRLAELALAALRAGKHVLAEKPLAADAATAAHALREWKALDGKLLYCVAENFRLEGAVRRVREGMDGLGRVLGVEVSAHNVMKEGSKYAFGWRVDGGSGVFGQMMDSGVHYVAAMRQVVGADVTRVAARAQECVPHLPGMDTVHAVLEFGNGVAGSFVCSFAGETFRWEMVVLCQRGRVSLRRAIVDGKYGYLYRREVGGEPVGEDEFMTFTGVRDEFTAFLEAVGSGKPDDRLSASTAFNDLAVIESFAKSSQSGTFVSVPPQP